jgi:hypothetical protein
MHFISIRPLCQRYDKTANNSGPFQRRLERRLGTRNVLAHRRSSLDSSKRKLTARLLVAVHRFVCRMPWQGLIKLRVLGTSYVHPSGYQGISGGLSLVYSFEYFRLAVWRADICAALASA